MTKYFAPSELIINEDGSIFHLHVRPEWLADKIILVGDPGRVDLVARHLTHMQCAEPRVSHHHGYHPKWEAHHRSVHRHWVRQH